MKNISRQSFCLLIIVAAIFANACESGAPQKPTPDAAKQDLILKGYKFDEPSFHQAIKDADLRAVNAFLIAGINPNAKNPAGVETALTAAISTGSEGNKFNAALIRALLDNKADPNLPNKNGDTPLTFALLKNNDAAANVLLDANADVNAPGRDGQTPFYIAVNGEHKDLIKKILDRNPDVNAVTAKGETAIIAAAANGDLPTTQEITKRGANVNQQSQSGGTPLMYAAGFGNLEVTRELLKAGAKPEIKNKKGRTALDIAKINNHPEIVQALQEKK